MKPTTPMKAIRLKCLDCCANQILEINKCHLTKCPLWRFRTGHRPKDVAPTDGIEDANILDEEIIEENIPDVQSEATTEEEG